MKQWQKLRPVQQCSLFRACICMENLLIVYYQNLHILHPFCTIIKQLIILQGEKQEVRFHSATIIIIFFVGGGGGGGGEGLGVGG